jgi:hypothetical protein
MPKIKIEIPEYCFVPKSGAKCQFYRTSKFFRSGGSCSVFDKKVEPVSKQWGVVLPCRECSMAAVSSYIEERRK